VRSEQYITPWIDGGVPIGKRFLYIEWVDGKTDIRYRCSMPCLELAGLSREIG